VRGCGCDGRLARGCVAARAHAPPALARSATAGASTPYASATGVPTSYARVRCACACHRSSHPELRSRVCVQVHGPVSREAAEWTAVAVEEGQLTEVLYEKANGEGIAKARHARRLASSLL